MFEDNPRYFSDGKEVPFPFLNEIMRTNLQALYITIRPYSNAKLLLEHDFRARFTKPRLVGGSSIEKKAFYRVCNWLLECNYYIDDSSWEEFIQPIKDVFRYRLNMENLVEKHFSTNAVLINLSKPRFEKNYNANMITATLAIPILNNYYSLKCNEKVFNNLFFSNVHINNIQIYPVVNKLKPYNVKIKAISNNNEFPLNFSQIDLNSSYVFSKSIELTNFIDVYSEQNDRKYLGVICIIPITIDYVDDLIHGSDGNVKGSFYITSELLRNHSRSKIEKMIGFNKKLVIISWYNYGFTVPKYSECVNILNEESVTSGIKVKRKNTTSIIPKYIKTYSERNPKKLDLYDVINKIVLEEIFIMKVLKRSKLKYKNLIKIIKHFEEGSLYDLKISERMRKDISFFQYSGMLKIDGDRIFICNLAYTIISKYLIEKYDLIYSKIISNNKIVHKSKLFSFFYDVEEISGGIFNMIIKNYMGRKNLHPIELEKSKMSNYIEENYYQNTLNGIDFNNNILKNYFKRLYDGIPILLNKYNFTLHLEAIVDKIDQNGETAICNDIKEDVKFICDLLISEGSIVRRNGGYFIPYETRIVLLYKKNPKMAYSIEELRKICYLPYYDHHDVIKKMSDKLLPIGSNYYCLKDGRTIDRCIEDGIKAIGINVYKELKKKNPNQNKSSITIEMYYAASEFGKLFGKNVVRSQCFDWINEWT